jgi:hypothetical protein
MMIDSITSVFSSKKLTIDDVVSGFQRNIDELAVLEQQHKDASAAAEEEAKRQLDIQKTEKEQAKRANMIKGKIEALIGVNS